jgi:hypothetical protein
VTVEALVVVEELVLTVFQVFQWIASNSNPKVRPPRRLGEATRAESPPPLRARAASAVCLWPLFSLVLYLLAGGKGSGVHPLVDWVLIKAI